MGKVDYHLCFTKCSGVMSAVPAWLTKRAGLDASGMELKRNDRGYFAKL